jgi:hypothetical protein
MAATSVPFRDDHETIPAGRVSCPSCAASFTPAGRQAYCSPACRKRAWRRRQSPDRPTAPAGPGRRALTAYECPNCGERQHGSQRCPDCGTFGRALGLAGTCPHCDGLIAAADLDRTT